MQWQGNNYTRELWGGLVKTARDKKLFLFWELVSGGRDQEQGSKNCKPSWAVRLSPGTEVKSCLLRQLLHPPLHSKLSTQVAGKRTDRLQRTPPPRQITTTAVTPQWKSEQTNHNGVMVVLLSFQVSHLPFWAESKMGKGEGFPFTLEAQGMAKAQNSWETTC